MKKVGGRTRREKIGMGSEISISKRLHLSARESAENY